MVLSLVALLLSGCGGIPQEDYDAAQSKVTSLQSDLSKAKGDLSKAKNDLSAAKTEAASLQTDLDAAESDLASAKSAKSSAESAKSAAERELSTVKSDLAAAEATIAELEAAAAAPAEEEVVEEEVVEEEVVEEEVAEEEVAEEEVVEEEAPAMAWVTYENADYGFSIKYPDEDWYEDVANDPAFYVVKAPATLPSLTLQVLESDLSFKDAFVDWLENTVGGTDIEIISESEGELSDGTAYSQFVCKWIYYGSYDLHGYYLAVQLNGKWLCVLVQTVGSMVEYDEALYKEIAHSLTFD